MKTAIAAAALGIAAVGAQAASITGSAKYAVELFGGTAPATAITLPALNITAATGIPAGSTVTVHVQFVGGRPAANDAGSIATTAALAGGVTPTLGSTLAASTTAAAGTGTPTATTNNADVLVYTLANTTTALGIGGNLLTIPAQKLTAAGLATAGSTVTANVTIFVGSVPAVVGGAVPTTGTLEAISGATTVASSAQGVTLTTTTGSTGQKIDVTATTPSTKFTTSGTAGSSDTGSSSIVVLGTYGQVNGTAKQADGSTAYTVAQAGADGTTTIDVTAPAGYFAALGTVGKVYLVPNATTNCAIGSAVVQSTAFATKAAAAAATKVSLPATALAATTGGSTPAPYLVCMSIDPASTAVLQTGAASIKAVLGQTEVAQDSSDTLNTTALTALANNGATADVASFFPNALSAYGYSTYLRVVNKGAVSAPISIALIDPATGVAGTSAVLGTLPAGAATTFTAAQVEAVIGTLDIAARPRLRLTAPTGSLQVQSFIQSPNGTFNEVSGVTSSN